MKKNFLQSDFTPAQFLPFEMRIFMRDHPAIKIVYQNSVHMTDNCQTSKVRGLCFGAMPKLYKIKICALLNNHYFQNVVSNKILPFR